MVHPFRSTSVQLVIVVKRSRENLFLYNWKDSKGQYPDTYNLLLFLS